MYMISGSQPETASAPRRTANTPIIISDRFLILLSFLGWFAFQIEWPIMSISSAS